MSDHNTHWSAKADWMRAKGAVEAAWSTEGHLVHLKLGAPPVDAPERDTQPSISPQQRERREREERRHLAQRASGGPVPRLSADD